MKILFHENKEARDAFEDAFRSHGVEPKFMKSCSENGREPKSITVGHLLDMDKVLFELPDYDTMYYIAEQIIRNIKKNKTLYLYSLWCPETFGMDSKGNIRSKGELTKNFRFSYSTGM